MLKPRKDRASKIIKITIRNIEIVGLVYSDNSLDSESCELENYYKKQNNMDSQNACCFKHLSLKSGFPVI
jgi:hypothetical protein